MTLRDGANGEEPLDGSQFLLSLEKHKNNNPNVPFRTICLENKKIKQQKGRQKCYKLEQKRQTFKRK